MDIKLTKDMFDLHNDTHVNNMLKTAQFIKAHTGSCQAISCSVCFLGKNNIKYSMSDWGLFKQPLCLSHVPPNNPIDLRLMLANQFIALFEEPTVVKLNLTEE